ncbi:hypothetical protein HDF15_004503 [Granulicella mallensis]|uniref:Uncharacterized protein n=1 Tax=Granulicella mallensis TaxID=940614 RepID=A0A7W7ZTZ0_9BACT|nr:hypothetical protein [Granulicella mallensis]
MQIKTLQEAFVFYSNSQACIDYVVSKLAGWKGSMPYLSSL